MITQQVCLTGYLESVYKEQGEDVDSKCVICYGFLSFAQWNLLLSNRIK